MTKKELIAAVAEESNLTNAQADKALTALFDTISIRLTKGEKTSWPGFGGFETTKRAAREGRNPKTGAPLKIAASTGAKFKPSSALKRLLND